MSSILFYFSLSCFFKKEIARKAYLSFVPYYDFGNNRQSWREGLPTKKNMSAPVVAVERQYTCPLYRYHLLANYFFR